MTIPKKLHMIWIGDPQKRPDAWIQTWKDHHPAWEFRLWGNAEYDSAPWRCKPQMEMFLAVKDYPGVADIMRYEILHRYGGVYVDADSIALRPLDESLLQEEVFAVYSSEKHAPGRVANGFLGSMPGHPIFGSMIDRISHLAPSDLYRRSTWRFQKRRVQAWELVGSTMLTDVVRKHREPIKILPSISFIPQYFCDKEERKAMEGGPVIYARHMWGTTLNRYEPRK